MESKNVIVVEGKNTKNLKEMTNTKYTIKFDKKDRTKGIGSLSRSKIISNSIEGDKFVVRKEHLQLFRNKGINFTIIKQ
jgi:hypothetical protein